MAKTKKTTTKTNKTTAKTIGKKNSIQKASVKKSPVKKTQVKKPTKVAVKKNPAQPERPASKENDPAASTNPIFPFGSPERIRQLAELVQIFLNKSIANNNTELVGPYSEIKHALYELADLKKKLESLKSLGIGL